MLDKKTECASKFPKQIIRYVYENTNDILLLLASSDLKESDIGLHRTSDWKVTFMLKMNLPILPNINILQGNLEECLS